MHEIEVKLKFQDKEKVISRLKEIGAKFKEKYELEDSYFNLTHKDMKNTHDLLRVRKKGNKSELTFKGKVENNSDTWKRIEINTEIKDPEARIKILDYLKFTKIMENKTTREYWELNDTEIAIISIKKPAEIDFIEIEGKNEEIINGVLDKLKPLVEVIGEDYFKKIDDAQKNN